MAGYSQSRSRPSKPRFRRKAMDWLMKRVRLSFVETILEKGSEPRFHPPTASKIFMEGFFCFRLMTLLNLSEKLVCEIYQYLTTDYKAIW